MSAGGRRAELVEALRPKLGLRQHMAEPLADALLPLVQKIEAELNANSERIAELEAELKDASDAYWREREQHEADRLAKDTEIGRLRRELTEANRRYEERTPTQWAYEQACHALEKHRERGDAAEAEVERLRASEEDDRPKDPGAWPTPGQWIYRWNRMPAERRLETATQAIVNAQEADECFRMDHKASLDEADTQRTVLAERAYTAEAQGDRARAERDQLCAAAERVRALHKPMPAKRVKPCGTHGPATVCSGCDVQEVTVCSHVGCNGWPCDTIAALDQAPAAEQDEGEGK